MLARQAEEFLGHAVAVDVSQVEESVTSLECGHHGLYPGFPGLGSDLAWLPSAGNHPAAIGQAADLERAKGADISKANTGGRQR